MLLIWGFKTLLAVLSRGRFHCPRCDMDTDYELVRPRRWFTFFFIPLIPLKWSEQYVRCTRCKGAFDEHALASLTSEQFDYLLALGTRGIAARVLCSERSGFEAVSPSDTDAALAFVRTFNGAAYGEQELRRDMTAFDGEQLVDYLRPLSEAMAIQGREKLVGQLLGFSSSTTVGTTEAGQRAVADMAAILGITASHLEGIRASVRAGHSNPPSGTKGL